MSKQVKFKELEFWDNRIKKLMLEALDNGYNIYLTDFQVNIEPWKRGRDRCINYFYVTKNNSGIYAYIGISASYEWYIETCTSHKPNYDTGTGWQIAEKENMDIEDIDRAYNKSEYNIRTGKEQKFDIVNDDNIWHYVEVTK